MLQRPSVPLLQLLLTRTGLPLPLPSSYPLYQVVHISLPPVTANIIPTSNMIIFSLPPPISHAPLPRVPQSSPPLPSTPHCHPTTLVLTFPQGLRFSGSVYHGSRRCFHHLPSSHHHHRTSRAPGHVHHSWSAKTRENNVNASLPFPVVDVTRRSLSSLGQHCSRRVVLGIHPRCSASFALSFIVAY